MSTNDSSSSPSNVTPMSTPHSHSHPVFSLSNIRQHIPETLDYSNYLIWRELFISALKGYQVFEHIDTVTPPSKDDSGYTQWH